jgi:hypothetical protein
VAAREVDEMPLPGKIASVILLRNDRRPLCSCYHLGRWSVGSDMDRSALLLAKVALV